MLVVLDDFGVLEVIWVQLDLPDVNFIVILHLPKDQFNVVN